MSVLQKLLPHSENKQIIQGFARKYGLVYFGYVNQIDDDHRVVRGLTVSVGHKDQHFCIGSSNGYDMAFVERSDTINGAKSHQRSSHIWHILEIDLKRALDSPHIFIGLHSHSDSFYKQLFVKYPDLRHVPLGSSAHYPTMFAQQYRLYGLLGRAIEIESIISPEIARIIAEHFGALAVEIFESSLFIYSEQTRLTSSLIDAMLQNGLWLAGQIDRAN